MDSHMTSAAPDRELIFVSLSRLLDDTYNHLADTRALYLSTHPQGPRLDPLAQAVHTLFERHYSEMALTIDLIIQRMHELGFAGAAGAANPSRSSMFARMLEAGGTEAMIEQLLENHEALLASTRPILAHLAKMNDEPTTVLLTTRLQIHQRTAQQLRALLANDLGAISPDFREAS